LVKISNPLVTEVKNPQKQKLNTGLTGRSNSGHKSKRSEKSQKSVVKNTLMKQMNTRLVDTVDKLKGRLEYFEAQSKKYKKLKSEYKNVVYKLDKSEMLNREQAEKLKTQSSHIYRLNKDIRKFQASQGIKENIVPRDQDCPNCLNRQPTMNTDLKQSRKSSSKQRLRKQTTSEPRTKNQSLQKKHEKLIGKATNMVNLDSQMVHKHCKESLIKIGELTKKFKFSNFDNLDQIFSDTVRGDKSDDTTSLINLNIQTGGNHPFGGSQPQYPYGKLYQTQSFRTTK
jgi:hypothetical protein